MRRVFDHIVEVISEEPCARCSSTVGISTICVGVEESCSCAEELSHIPSAGNASIQNASDVKIDSSRTFVKYDVLPGALAGGKWASEQWNCE
jgi:hypothetical protein